MPHLRLAIGSFVLVSLALAGVATFAAGATDPQESSQAVTDLMSSGFSPSQTGDSNPPGVAPLAREQTAAGKERRILEDVPARGKYASRVFLPGLPEVGIFDPAAGFAETDETQLIQLVYDTYSRYSERPDGERVRFTFHGFRTVYRDRFAEVAYYPDLATLGHDWEIEATLMSRQDDDGVGSVEFQAEWIAVENPLARPDLASMVGLSALEMIDFVAGYHPQWRRTVAITSYEVTAEFLGRAETYRGAFVWLLDDSGELSYAVVDGIVPQSKFAVLETLPPRAEVSKSEPGPFDVATAASGTCVQQTWPTRDSPQMTDHNSTEHNTGKHEGVYIGKFDCSCDSTCLSQCTPGFTVQACQEYGNLIAIGLLHQKTSKPAVAGGSSQDGHLGGASCTSGFGCFIESCPGQSCAGVSIKIGGGIGGLTFSTDATTILGTSFSHTHRCGACTESEEEEPPTGPGLPEDQGDPNGGGDPVLDDDTPILVDLDRGGFELTGLESGVRFDLDGDGHRERVSWTVEGSGDAWLALDRNGNGTIDDGTELFGDVTPQPSSPKPHGFAALAVFDSPADGGDEDGLISQGDSIFPDLRLWVDLDHDGISDPGELSSLPAHGVRAIDLRYIESRRSDRHGNEFRYKSLVRLTRGTTQCADVFLLSAH